MPTGTAQPDAATPVCVSFGVWTAQDVSGAPVDHGQAFTSAEVDWTVKVEAGSLSPDSTYYYRFADCTNNATVSVTGTTRTLPSPDSTSTAFNVYRFHAEWELIRLLAPADQVNGGKPITFAVFSCANYPYGYFNAYSYAAEKVNADIFIHLGDYVSFLSCHDPEFRFAEALSCRSMSTKKGTVSYLFASQSDEHYLMNTCIDGNG